MKLIWIDDCGMVWWLDGETKGRFAEIQTEINPIQFSLHSVIELLEIDFIKFEFISANH